MLHMTQANPALFEGGYWLCKSVLLAHSSYFGMLSASASAKVVWAVGVCPTPHVQVPNRCCIAGACVHRAKIARLPKI